MFFWVCLFDGGKDGCIFGFVCLMEEEKIERSENGSVLHPSHDLIERDNERDNVNAGLIT